MRAMRALLCLILAIHTYNVLAVTELFGWQHGRPAMGSNGLQGPEGLQGPFLALGAFSAVRQTPLAKGGFYHAARYGGSAVTVASTAPGITADSLARHNHFVQLAQALRSADLGPPLVGSVFADGWFA